MLVNYYHDALLKAIVLISHQKSLYGRDQSFCVSFHCAKSNLMGFRERLGGLVSQLQDVGCLIPCVFDFLILLLLLLEILFNGRFWRLLRLNLGHHLHCLSSGVTSATCVAIPLHRDV